MLPCEDRYCPPLTFSAKDVSLFGQEFLIGTAIVKSLLRFQVPEEEYFKEIIPIGGVMDLPPADEEAENNEEGGLDNEGFVGDDAKSVVSKVGSKAKSVLGSVAGTIKTVTFVPEGMEKLGSGFKTPSRKSILKTPSKAPSLAGSRTGSRAASRQPSFAGSRAGSKAASRAGSYVASHTGSRGRPPSLAGSRAVSIAENRSRAGSLFGSKAASIIGSKAGSIAGSIARSGPFAGLRLGSEAAESVAQSEYQRSRAGSFVSGVASRAGSRLQTLLATPSKASQASRVSHISRRSVLPTPRKMSMGKLEHSSTIHTHILSSPGSGRKPPTRRRSLRYGSATGSVKLESLREEETFTASNEELRMPSKKKKKSISEVRGSRAGSQTVTPFKQLMSQKGTPETAPLLKADDTIEEEFPDEIASQGRRKSASSNKKSLIEQISTPIRSIGSKLATPLASLKKSAGGSPGGATDPEDMELGMGAEASDFYDEVMNIFFDLF